MGGYAPAGVPAAKERAQRKPEERSLNGLLLRVLR